MDRPGYGSTQRKHSVSTGVSAVVLVTAMLSHDGQTQVLGLPSTPTACCRAGCSYDCLMTLGWQNYRLVGSVSVKPAIGEATLGNNPSPGVAGLFPCFLMH